VFDGELQQHLSGYPPVPPPSLLSAASFRGTSCRAPLCPVPLAPSHQTTSRGVEFCVVTRTPAVEGLHSCQAELAGSSHWSTWGEEGRRASSSRDVLVLRGSRCVVAAMWRVSGGGESMAGRQKRR
ncbi:unnamed protein product, partial [Closterium sp. Naga37s-1]